MIAKASRRLRAALTGLVVSLTVVSVASVTSAARATASSSTALFSRAAWSGAAADGNLDPQVLDLALEAAASAVQRGTVAVPATLTVIDYSRPSTARRLWVFDVRSHALLFDELVAHGRGSGTRMATAFSNTAESDMSSLGLFRTAETYFGHDGYSLRLDGLEPGVNDQARARDIVVHGAVYVSAAIAKSQGYLGRSLGCPAVRLEVAHALIDAIKGGGLLFAYYPDAEWLHTSRFLN
jgi:hypothetical protein